MSLPSDPIVVEHSKKIIEEVKETDRYQMQHNLIDTTLPQSKKPMSKLDKKKKKKARKNASRSRKQNRR